MPRFRAIHPNQGMTRRLKDEEMSIMTSVRKWFKPDTRLLVKLMLSVFVLIFMVNSAAGFYALEGLTRLYEEGVE